jgi:hypothetical protein
MAVPKNIRTRSKMMMSTGPKQTVLATVCVGILVAIAFFAAYAGQTFSQVATAPQDGLSITNIVGLVQAAAASITFLIIAFVAVRQLRAHVYPGQIAVHFHNFSVPMVIALEIKNTGATPAKNVEIHGSIFYDKSPLDDNFSFARPVELSGARHSKLPLYPNVPNTTTFTAAFTFSQQIINELMTPSPKHTIYLFGEVNYVDMFWFKRRTQFCYFMEPNDMVKLIRRVHAGGAIDPVYRWTAAHVMNRFT